MSWVESGVFSKQSGPDVSLSYPAPPSSGEAHLRLESPPVCTEIEYPGRIVLTGRNHHGDAGSNQSLLAPLHIFPDPHGRAAMQVYRYSYLGICHAGRGRLGPYVGDTTLKSSCYVGQSHDDIRRPTQ